MTNKDEVVSTLLTLRAGLSAVARENYKANKMIEMAEEINEELRQKEQIKPIEIQDCDGVETKACIQKTETEAVRHALFHINSGLNLAYTLENAYENFLSVLEWERLDNVIYYLEKGKAQSLDEALKLLDCDRQNGSLGEMDDEILQVVNKVINEKADSLESKFGKVTDDILAEYQIAHSDYDEIRHWSATYSGVNVTSLYIKEMVSPKNFIRLLKEYSLVSSYELFDEMRELKNNSEHLSWKRNIEVE